MTQSGLPPIVGPSPRILLLGSFPSQESLRRSEYYANPKNQFWKLLSAVLDVLFSASYEQRVATSMQCRVALWDVLQKCARQGSLDARIDRNTMVPNDIAAFLHAAPSIQMIGLNGGMAVNIFDRYCRASMRPDVQVVPLPSSSSAHAAMSFAQKLQAWSVMKKFTGC